MFYYIYCTNVIISTFILGKKMYQIYRDDKLIKEVNTEKELYDYMHNVQPFSIDWACKHEGYKIYKRKKND